MIEVGTIRGKFAALRPYLDERRRRLWAATEAQALGRGGVALVATATGLQRNTIRAGVRERETPGMVPLVSAQRVRAPGGGRKPVTTEDPTLLHDLEALVDPVTRGDPMSPLRWTCKSTRELAVALQERGHRVSHQTVADLLHALRYSLQGNRKTNEGATHPDRDAQFTHINAQTEAFQQRGQPVISVDTKKKELVGDFKNGGREWQPAGQPEPVRVHDFVDRDLGKAIPYGVYDLAHNQGWVTVGTDHDTPTFAVQAVRSWWGQMGHPTYPPASGLLITAGGGGHPPLPPRGGGCGPRGRGGAAPAAGPAGGRPSSSDSLTRPACGSASATSRPAPASGTRSNTGCSATSPKTGADDHSSVAKSSSSSSGAPPPAPASRSARPSTPALTPPASR